MSPLRTVIISALAACLLIPSCDRPPLTGPPELRLGRDGCAECGMLINEDRCAAALIVEAPPSSGQRKHLVFDDIGCLLDAELNRAAEFTVIERYFRDYAERAWVRAESAACVIAPADNLSTPMGSGMVGFGSADTAARSAKSVGGTATDYAGLLEARRRWWESRRLESGPKR